METFLTIIGSLALFYFIVGFGMIFFCLIGWWENF
jgi:hypothetical protein